MFDYYVRTYSLKAFDITIYWSVNCRRDLKQSTFYVEKQMNILISKNIYSETSLCCANIPMLISNSEYDEDTADTNAASKSKDWQIFEVVFRYADSLYFLKFFSQLVSWHSRWFLFFEFGESIFKIKQIRFPYLHRYHLKTVAVGPSL